MATRIWLITGASSGIGLELALHAASRGDRVIATSRTPQKLDYLREKAIVPAYLDHNKPLSEIEADLAKIISIYGTIDILVNNAAYVQTGILEEVSPDDTLRQFQANVFGPLNIFRAILPHLRSRKSGTLVTIGSMAAWYPMPGCNLYNASKAAMRSLGLGLAGEVAHLGIRHCLVEPGFFRTELLNPTANIAVTDSASWLPDYADINKTTDDNFAHFHGRQLGDPTKGAEIIYDVLTSTGCAAGRPLPSFLPLGSDASAEISKAARSAVAVVEDLQSIGALSDFSIRL
ncbi:hypothetical protein MBLNU459_g0816t1 [Dothideomycetes sp. NU459]